MRGTSCRRDSRRWRWWCLAALVVAGPEAVIGAEPASRGNAEEAAIRASIDSYVRAYNARDAKAVAAHWSESGEWISPGGQRFQGRQAIEQQIAELFAGDPQVRIEVLQPAVRIVAPDAAVEQGTVRVLRPKEPPEDSTYMAVHVKKDGAWKLDCVRETEQPRTAEASSSLQDLAWLVGDWVDQQTQATVEGSVSWTRNKAFLNYSFRVSAPNQDLLEGAQVIGWDPAAKTIRSWLFDSDGGIGEGTWSRQGNSWVVKFSQVLPDGRKAWATNIYTPLDANTFTWKSIGRTVDGEQLPGIDETRVVRKVPPAVPGKPAAQSAKVQTGK